MINVADFLLSSFLRQKAEKSEPEEKDVEAAEGLLDDNVRKDAPVQSEDEEDTKKGERGNGRRQQRNGKRRRRTRRRMMRKKGGQEICSYV